MTTQDPIPERELRIVRRFTASPGVVFDTLTKPEAMRVWWTDDTLFNIDLRVGGKWTISRKEADVTYTMVGEYLEVERPRRLRYTIAMPQFSPNTDTVSIDIVPHGQSGSEMTFVQRGIDIAAELRDLPAGAISESEKGYQQGFDLMAAAWENK
jgi:uncharacterized protein YndB with AHSA1/START domain